MQPGVASVHASVLQKAPNGVAFYIRDFPSMASMKYGDVRRRFNTSILCGWFSGEDRLPHLNPKDDYIVKKDDKLIFLANSGAVLQHDWTAMLSADFEQLPRIQKACSALRSGWEPAALRIPAQLLARFPCCATSISSQFFREDVSFVCYHVHEGHIPT